MMFVQVIHQANPEYRFWFEVPRDLTLWVQTDYDVICNTAKGLARGKVVRLVDGLSDDEFKDLFGFFPTAEVYGVYKNMNVELIDVPEKLYLSHPAPSKIAKRVRELYAGGFKTRIELDPYLELKDGYTAYLVARMFNIDKLPNCLISIGAESIYKTVPRKGSFDND